LPAKRPVHPTHMRSPCLRDQMNAIFSGTGFSREGASACNEISLLAADRCRSALAREEAGASDAYAQPLPKPSQASGLLHSNLRQVIALVCHSRAVTTNSGRRASRIIGVWSKVQVY
jgi:hypothetical protein